MSGWLTRDDVADSNPEAIFADGFDEALVGVCHQFGRPAVAAYDLDVCLRLLRNEGMSAEEAAEYFDYNVVGAWHGEETPVFVRLGRTGGGGTVKQVAVFVYALVGWALGLVIGVVAVGSLLLATGAGLEHVRVLAWAAVIGQIVGAAAGAGLGHWIAAQFRRGGWTD